MSESFEELLKFFNKTWYSLLCTTIRVPTKELRSYSCHWESRSFTSLQVISFTLKVSMVYIFSLEFGSRNSANGWFPISVGLAEISCDHTNVSADGAIVSITFSVSLCPVESLWSSISLWKTNFILHSWQIHIAFRSSGCIGSIMGFRSLNIMINQSHS